MKHFGHIFLGLTLLLGTVLLRAETESISPAFPGRSAATNAMPPLPHAQSPVVFFRELLAMPTRERIAALTNRPPQVRDRLLEKVREYQAMPPDERELTLRATELRWYLMPLLRQSPTNRFILLQQVPDELKPLAQNRLAIWDLLPPPLQQEFLENDRTLHYFARMETSNNAALNPPLEEHRQQLAGQFNQFFELTVREKKATLSTLSQTEQEQMQKTLETFEHLSGAQRLQCLRSFTRFAGMNSIARAEFLKNAERWSQMSPGERQAWRDLVANVPQWPPLPPSALLPPPLPPPIKVNRPPVATNAETTPPAHAETRLLN